MTAIGPRGGEYKNEEQMRMKAIWRTKAWQERTTALLLSHPRCEWCNGKAGVINHRRQGYYEGYELCRREEVDIICQECHLYWTDPNNNGTKGQQRPRLYDDCDSCEAPIYIGRNVCFMCGSKGIVKKSKHTPEQQKRLLDILSRCPEVRIGDRWSELWSWEGEVEVTGFEKHDLPWPLVQVKIADKKDSVGLPAFMFATLVFIGEGKSNQESA